MKVYVVVRKSSGNAIPSERDPDIFPTAEAAERHKSQQENAGKLKVEERDTETRAKGKPDYGFDRPVNNGSLVIDALRQLIADKGLDYALACVRSAIDAPAYLLSKDSATVDKHELTGQSIEALRQLVMRLK